jgi:hypothetical protein
MFLDCSLSKANQTAIQREYLNTYPYQTNMVSNNIHIQFHAFAPLALILNLGTGKAKHRSAQKVPSPMFLPGSKGAEASYTSGVTEQLSC